MHTQEAFILSSDAHKILAYQMSCRCRSEGETLKQLCATAESALFISWQQEGRCPIINSAKAEGTQQSGFDYERPQSFHDDELVCLYMTKAPNLPTVTFWSEGWPWWLFRMHFHVQMSRGRASGHAKLHTESHWWGQIITSCVGAPLAYASEGDRNGNDLGVICDAGHSNEKVSGTSYQLWKRK